MGKRNRRRRKVRETTDDDESFAMRSVNAQLDHAMGIDNPDYDWLVDPYLDDKEGAHSR